MDFIWNNLYCSNVRVEIYHLKDEASSKIQADPDVKNAFTKCGFKWKTLSNDPATGKRAQVMQANRPPNSKFDESLRNITPGMEPLTIKAAVYLDLTKQKVDPSEEVNSADAASMISCTLGCLKHFKEERKVETSLVELNQGITHESVKKLLNVFDALPIEASFAA
jgi:hypothetical protein